ncbi:MAG: dihydrolipoamide acetyltransferase family protein [Bacteroidales bacterium]
MALFEIKMPKMGESIEEATITKWFVKEGDQVQEDDVLLEIATDKVDSEIPSPVAGKVSKILFKVNDLVPVGKVVALIDTEGGAGSEDTQTATASVVEEGTQPEVVTKVATERKEFSKMDTRFYSPLVRNIAAKERISPEELASIPGSGRNGRVRKQDILEWIQHGRKKVEDSSRVEAPQTTVEKARPSISVWPGDEVIEMDRVRKLIADHMVMSKRTAAHVTNIVEADVTELVMWRNKVKDEFEAREKQKFTFMPAVTHAVARALRDFPRVNISVDGYNIIIRKAVNIGIAVATPDGNLIVPVVKNADQLSLTGLALEINRLADLARKGKLSPDDIQGGTFSITNFGTFRNLMGTPVINQPQAAILAVGTIEKKPSVLETPSGDVIAIRHKMYLSLTYDHRAIDGALGGAFLRRVADYLEKFDTAAKV